MSCHSHKLAARSDLIHLAGVHEHPPLAQQSPDYESVRQQRLPHQYRTDGGLRGPAGRLWNQSPQRIQGTKPSLFLRNHVHRLGVVPKQHAASADECSQPDTDPVRRWRCQLPRHRRRGTSCKSGLADNLYFVAGPLAATLPSG
jgi:hypothetical protein